MLQSGSKLSATVFNLTLNKVELTFDLPSDPTSFLGRSEANISLTQAGDASPIVLCDGNRTVYPMAKDFRASIREPQWINLAPVTTLSMSMHSILNATQRSKSKVRHDEKKRNRTSVERYCMYMYIS